MGSKERRTDKRRKERGGGGRGEGGTQRSVLRNGSCNASRAVIDLFPKVIFLCIQDPNQGGVYGCLFWQGSHTEGRKEDEGWGTHYISTSTCILVTTHTHVQYTLICAVYINICAVYINICKHTQTVYKLHTHTVCTVYMYYIHTDEATGAQSRGVGEGGAGGQLPPTFRRLLLCLSCHSLAWV